MKGVREEWSCDRTLSESQAGLRAESVFEVTGRCGCSLTELSCGLFGREIGSYTRESLWKIDCVVWQVV